MDSRLFHVLLFFVLINAPFSAAFAYDLSTRQLPNGEYEAVVNYDTGGSCFVQVSPADSIEINGFEVLIESPEHPSPPVCGSTQRADCAAIAVACRTIPAAARMLCRC